MWFTRVASLLLALTVAGPLRADVVINEILYHAPDDLDNLQFIELHNTGDQPVDLAGWKFAKAIKYAFPPNAAIAANGYLVVCKNLKEFKTHYGFDAAGEFTGSMGHASDNVELVNAKGKKVDGVKYKTRAPWPVAADGYSSSLERICPTTAATGPENWAPSPMAPGTPKPMGTPGKKNASHAERLPPFVSKVAFTPECAKSDQEIRVEADIKSSEELRDIHLLYRAAGSGFETKETAIAMTKTANGAYEARIPPHKTKSIVRFRIRAADAQGAVRLHPHSHELRPAYSVFVCDSIELGACPGGFIINIGQKEFKDALRGVGPAGGYGGVSPTPPGRGNSAFVFVDPKTGVPTLFDFISIGPRSGGQRIRFHKDRPLGDMTTIVLIFEHMDRWVLAEPLAYEVYRRAGNAASRTDHVRTWIDDRPIGYQLLIESVNKSFLKHNKVRNDGNLYKLNWFGGSIVGTHEKKTRVRDGHDDLLKIVDLLNKTKGDEQWAVIKKNFNVEQFINYFAVNLVLSHWDGYFNNHFTYNDIKGTGKWTIYPWDQDKTWGYHDGIRGYDVFTDMPLSLGMAGDTPPGWPKGKAPPNSFDFNYSIWWRPGGVFAKPLLANPQFRQLYLARTKELLESVYTEETFFPIIDKMGDRLKDEVKVRAELRRQDPKFAAEHLRRNLGSLKEHLTKRRKFLLEQDEIKKAGTFDRSLLKANLERPHDVWLDRWDQTHVKSRMFAIHGIEPELLAQTSPGQRPGTARPTHEEP